MSSRHDWGNGSEDGWLGGLACLALFGGFIWLVVNYWPVLLVLAGFALVSVLVKAWRV